LLNESLTAFRNSNRGHQIDIVGVVINNSAYHYSGNYGGPERERALREIQGESNNNSWHVFINQIPLSRGFPKMMRGDFNYLGDAPLFRVFASEFFKRLGLEQ
jgi:chromosome partitioning protein